MPAASTSMTYKELKKRVALRAEMTMQQAGVKVARTDEPVATMLEEAIADGVKDFFRSNNWAFQMQPVQLTLSPDGTGALNINRDPRRYLLPACVESMPRGTAMFRGPNGQPGTKIKIRPIDTVAARAFGAPDASGSPIAIGSSWSSLLASGMSETSGRFELMVDPKPDLAYVLRLKVKIGPIPFVADHQVGNWPSVHDLTVVDFCTQALFEHDKDMGDADQARAYAASEARKVKSLGISIDRDNEDFRDQELGSLDEEDFSPGRLLELTDLESGQVILSTTVYS